MELDAGLSPAPPCLSARRKDWGGHAGLRHTVLAGNVPGGRRTARSIDTHPGLPVLICSLARISDPPWSRELARLCRVIHAEDVPEAEGRRRTDRRHATTAEQRRTRRRPYIGGQVGGGGGGRGAHLGGRGAHLGGTVARPTKAARFPLPDAGAFAARQQSVQSGGGGRAGWRGLRKTAMHKRRAPERSRPGTARERRRGAPGGPAGRPPPVPSTASASKGGNAATQASGSGHTQAASQGRLSIRVNGRGRPDTARIAGSGGHLADRPMRAGHPPTPPPLHSVSKQWRQRRNASKRRY